MLAWSPAFMGFPDASAYVSMASKSLWADPTHEVGYALFLRDLHVLGGVLWPTIAIQHILGLASAVFWWLIIRRCGGPPWLALIPAAVVALDGGEMFLEHSTMSESLFIFLLSAGLYCAVRGLEGDRARWAGAAGLLLAVDCTVRVVALPLLAILLLWLVLISGGDLRLRARRAGAAGACAVVILASYAIVQHGQTGYWGLTTPAGAWNLYSRVAPFADCHEFKPPPGTAVLCEQAPPAQRTASVADYAYSSVSPAVRAYSWGNGPYSATPSENRELASFTRAVMLHQPVDYLEAVLEGMTAYVTPARIEFANRSELAPDDQFFFHRALFDPTTLASAARTALPYYGEHSFHENRSLMRFVFAYESTFRVTGPIMAAMMILSLFALFAPAGQARRIARLLFLVAWVSLIVPPATHEWDARYAIPALGPLAGVGALGAWQLGRVVGHGRRVVRRSRVLVGARV
ncbi:MAG TPA: glycosyltransferase family 39 protein [Solirubrobacteraceae bacterium]|nr:glycosyltransferase family 39 protein [Solirubrobacteraceae bacterium]